MKALSCFRQTIFHLVGFFISEKSSRRTGVFSRTKANIGSWMNLQVAAWILHASASFGTFLLNWLYSLFLRFSSWIEIFLKWERPFYVKIRIPLGLTCPEAAGPCWPLSSACSSEGSQWRPSALAPGCLGRTCWPAWSQNYLALLVILRELKLNLYPPPVTFVFTLDHITYGEVVL